MTTYRETEPDKLPQALDSARGQLLIVDYDETLWLRNSTEAFLASARPAALAATILWTLDRLRLWRVLGGRGGSYIYRDWIRVLAIICLMPWSLRAWTASAPRLGRLHANQYLETCIVAARPRQIVILSNGFRRLIEPLLMHLSLPSASLVAGPLLAGARWRKTGKRALAEARFRSEDLDHATLVTDHVSDQDLLERVGNGLLCKWPNARYRRAFGARAGAKRMKRK